MHYDISTILSAEMLAKMEVRDALTVLACCWYLRWCQR